MSKADVSIRRAEALAARARFMETLQEVQNRLSPQSMTADLKEKVREKAAGAIDAAKDGVAQAATHPSTVAAVTVPVLLYLFRKPLGRGLDMLRGKGTAEPADDDAPAKETKAPPVRRRTARPRKTPVKQGV